MKWKNSQCLQILSCKAIHNCIKLKQSRKIKDFQAKKHIPARVSRYAYAHMKTQNKNLFEEYYFLKFSFTEAIIGAFFLPGHFLSYLSYTQLQKNPMKNNWISKDLTCIFDILNYNKNKIKQASNRKMQLVNCLSKLVE